jgi:MFS family permease
MSSAAVKTNKHMVLAVTMVANFFNPFTGSAVNIALPQIASDLQLHAGLMSWVTLAYLLTAASFLVPMGKLGDRIGRKKCFSGAILLLCLALLAAPYQALPPGLSDFVCCKAWAGP